MAIDYDKYMLKQDGPEPETEETEMDERDDMTYCADPWCDGHSLPSQTCSERAAGQ